jgi:hypothetical protein
MQFPILVEPTADGRFRARIGEPFQLSATADNAKQALDDLAQQVTQRLRTGASVAILTVPGGVAQVTAGPLPADDMYKTDWVYRELTEEMAANRREEDSVGP